MRSTSRPSPAPEAQSRCRVPTATPGPMARTSGTRPAIPTRTPTARSMATGPKTRRSTATASPTNPPLAGRDQATMLELFKIAWDIAILRDGARKGQVTGRVMLAALGFAVLEYAIGLPAVLLYDKHPQYKPLFIAA